MPSDGTVTVPVAAAAPTSVTPPTPTPSETVTTGTPSSATPKSTAKTFPKVRRHWRVPVTGKLHAGEHGDLEVTNISESGLFCRTEAKIPTGTELKFTLCSSAFATELKMTGVVIRQSSEPEVPGFAIEFTRMNPVHKRIIAEYVKSQS